MRGDYKNLKARQEAHKLATSVYSISGLFPKDELYGLTSQIRRASISIVSNIAEGNERLSDKEFLRFLEITSGSCVEVETQLYIAYDLGYLEKSQLDSVLHQVLLVKKLIGGLQKKQASSKL